MKEGTGEFSTLAMANINVDFYIYFHFIGPFFGHAMQGTRIAFSSVLECIVGEKRWMR